MKATSFGAFVPFFVYSPVLERIFRHINIKQLTAFDCQTCLAEGNTSLPCSNRGKTGFSSLVHIASGLCPTYLKSANEGNEYNVDGDWLATRWQPTEGADYEYEWWDIESIQGSTMKWSALREKTDGTRYTTTFTWIKIQ